LEDIPIVYDFPFPKPGQLRFSLLTPLGVHALTVQESDVSSRNHRLAPLFVAWDQLVTQVRLTDPAEYKAASQRSAAKYTHCLLTMLAEKSLGPVEITVGRLVPDLWTLATTPDDEKLLQIIELPRDEIDAAIVISILKKTPRLRWKWPLRKIGEFPAKRALSTGQAVDVWFELEQTRDELGQPRLLVRSSE
jgi:hypothetical protein